MTGGRVLQQTGRRIASWVDSRWTVPLAALAAFLLRMPGLTRPVRADEAGFLLVARSWDPQPDSLYGHFFVDRPPLLIAVFRGADALAGPLTIRVLGALACALLVVLAAGTARSLAGDRSARWTAVCVAAMTTNTLIDAVAVKGELLGLPFVMAACWLSLAALQRRSAPLALLAGLCAGIAPGFKQNLAGGLVFAGVLLLVAVATRRVGGRDFARLAAAGLAGAAVPVGATIAWSLAAGVRLETLWYAVFGFRSDAALVLADGNTQAPTMRALLLLTLALGAGMLLILGGFVVHVRSEWAEDRAVTAATLALLVFDVTALVAGGSYWRDYLFPLVPATALAAALLVRRASRRGLATRTIVVGAALSSAACLVGWVLWNAAGMQEFDEHDTGVAIAAAAEPADTLVVFGGRADVQLESGLDSPYRHLWSLPMRTLDRDLDELTDVVAGPDAPTWLVEWVDFTTWDRDGGERLRDLVEDRYVLHGTGCDGRRVWLLRGVERPPLEPDCA
ncbi:ArnT family glycosyltransferase [Nocardioides pantholopis]|uniref:ArnT family glycosyltransferase n=1 Tax=Nocardioides pantholopis TaxID=2483798 RepID=UPI0013DDBD53|nr:glycosyltransferase family 39 protein [Nocardioides pantholopis]